MRLIATVAESSRQCGSNARPDGLLEPTDYMFGQIFAISTRCPKAYAVSEPFGRQSNNK
jgi:hypothetical protein